MTATVILDTGPWVALHCRDERHHGWAVEQFAQHAGPFITCESVVTETCFLLARAGFDPAKALALVERGVVRIGMVLGDEASAVRKLFERYDNVPASLADACLIRLSEIYDDSRVLTLDSDFHVYRRHGAQGDWVVAAGVTGRGSIQRYRYTESASSIHSRSTRQGGRL